MRCLQGGNFSAGRVLQSKLHLWYCLQHDACQAALMLLLWLSLPQLVLLGPWAWCCWFCWGPGHGAAGAAGHGAAGALGMVSSLASGRMLLLLCFQGAACLWPVLRLPDVCLMTAVGTVVGRLMPCGD